MSGYLRKMARKQLHAGGGLMKRTSREHYDVLQNIEAIFVAAYRGSLDVDDHACHAAIEAMLMGQNGQGPVVSSLVAGLTDVRRLRADISDKVWHDALRVVAESIRTHSERRSGDVDYLKFVSAYIP